MRLHLRVVSVKNSAHVRELALGHLKLFGIKLDQERNLAARFGKSGVISC